MCIRRASPYREDVTDFMPPRTKVFPIDQLEWGKRWQLAHSPASRSVPLRGPPGPSSRSEATRLWLDEPDADPGTCHENLVAVIKKDRPGGERGGRRAGLANYIERCPL